VLKVWIDGHQYFDRDQDLKDRDTLADRKKQLIAKEKADDEAAKKKRDSEKESDKKPKSTSEAGAL
jgi:hypothetical protein